jgi:hypothetical protein
MKFLLFFLTLSFFSLFFVNTAHAQRYYVPTDTPTPEVTTQPTATESAIASASAKEQAEIQKLQQQDVTRPESSEDDKVLQLFKQREALTATPINFVAYMVQTSVRAGVPSRTVILILLLPMLATIIAFIRHVIGLPGVGMLVPIALAITLLSTGITSGIILLATIMFASTFARILLKKVRIMQLPKMAMSMFIVSIFIFLVLTLSALAGLLVVKQLSIFPVLLLILLSEQIISVQLERSAQEMIIITLVTFALGILGFLLLSSVHLRNTILLYPELIFLLIPLNIIIGRYFGLRLMEYFRFSSISNHGNK